MREIFITDIHNQFTKFISLLDKANYDKNKDLLILGGDYFDRGPEASEVAQWLEENYNNDNVVLLLGNHDLALLQLLEGDESLFSKIEIKFMIKNNGLGETLESLYGKDYADYSNKEIKEKINKRYPRLLKALKSAKFVHETNNAIYTHSELLKNYKTASRKELEDAVWVNSRDWANSYRWKSRKDISKPVIIGHYALPNFKDWDKKNPIKVNGIIFADGGLGWGYNGTVHIINSK